MAVFFATVAAVSSQEGSSALAQSTPAGQTYRVAAVSDPPPLELAAAVREALSPMALKIVGTTEGLCELWLRWAVPSQPLAKGAGIAFGAISEGTLVGAMRFSGQAQDFRNQPIPPGVYTLRYALMPMDGNHTGVAPQRDFLLIAPASADLDPATLMRDQALDLSRKATGSNHPSIWSLGPVAADAPALPALLHRQDNDLWILEFQVVLGDEGKPVPMSLVIAGHAPENGIQ